MQFEWDQRKAANNQRKHKVAFADAITVFADPHARIFPDPDHSEAEEREIIVGYDAATRLLYISFVERHGNVRIISARRATNSEARAHESYLK
ncbi:MAG: BrnT family toxin [Dokdonella sp.]|jgi:uncharacterized protein|uniref:BrnT family toxin n=1 Tax=Dokdonella sp. TaxID=2291710 RepID=UPI001B44C25C|nr:BrnT family toxin [Dokdonella sp.]MBP6327885.1 BrnT family toxin [Dokdonella sp.]MBP6328749.1 BrnT family toxin [Dokdonella sp.]MCC6440737.1 BrnT family toxin [Rhodanobacteraceae bacterium]HQV47902.1 BrnT family toxin [Dokdonella sp.]